jgi:hypothetical protein
LLRHERFPEHLTDIGQRFVSRETNTDTALGVFGQLLELPLAATARVNLRFDDPNRARLPSDSDLRLVQRCHDGATGNRSPISLQHLFRLILMYIHVFLPSARASTDSLDETQSFFEFWCSRVTKPFEHDHFGCYDSCPAGAEPL